VSSVVTSIGASATAMYGCEYELKYAPKDEEPKPSENEKIRVYGYGIDLI
jgi:hypothetical protein